MQSKHSAINVILFSFLSALVFLSWIAHANTGLWEPWEAATTVLVERMAQSKVNELVFWVPQIDGELVARPYLQLWLLLAVGQLGQELTPLLLRLPGLLIGIYLLVLTFMAMGKVSSQRAAWVTVLLLLCTPMFVFGTKLVHGGLYFVLAVTAPLLHYILAVYASNQRIQRTSSVFMAASLFISFLAGGFLALALVISILALFALALRRHPQRKAFYAPLRSRQFIVSSYLAFLLIVLVFGQYLSQSRYALERRQPLTLSALNEALDEGRVDSIYQRGTQIIGQFQPNLDSQKSQAFVLSLDPHGYETQADQILKQDESNRRLFSTAMQTRFGQDMPRPTTAIESSLEDAIRASLRFFSVNRISPEQSAKRRLARVDSQRLLEQPKKALIYSEKYKNLFHNWIQSTAFSPLLIHENIAELNPHAIVEILEDSRDGVTIKIAYNDIQGYVDKSILNEIHTSPSKPWGAWLRILALGFFPVFAFAPLFLAMPFIATKQLNINRMPYQEELYSENPSSDKIPQSPLQWLLLLWFLLSIPALYIGIAWTQHMSFAGLIAFAMMGGIALSSPKLWALIHTQFELRFLLIALALAYLVAVLYQLRDQTLYFIQYLLTDPLTHWPKSIHNFNAFYLPYAIFFALTLIFALSSNAAPLRKRILALFRNPEIHENPKNKTQSLPTIAIQEDQGPALSLLFAPLVAALFIYHVYFPTIAVEMTESHLLKYYLEKSTNTEEQERLYIVQDKTTHFCRSYNDCDAGYICAQELCSIPNFSEYSLSIATPLSRDDLLQHINPYTDIQAAYYAIPKDLLLELNQDYRRLFLKASERKNLFVTTAPSSRLYLLSSLEEGINANPYERVFLTNLPSDATPLNVPIDDDIQLQGFKMDALKRDTQGQLHLTLFLKIKTLPSKTPTVRIKLEGAQHNESFEHSLLNGQFQMRQILENDIVADHRQLSFKIPAARGLIDIYLELPEKNLRRIPLTTIDF